MSQAAKQYFDQHHQYRYLLPDSGIVVHVPMYIKNTNDLFSELFNCIEWSKFKYQVYDRTVDSPRLMNIVRWDTRTDKIEDTRADKMEDTRTDKIEDTRADKIENS